MVSGGAASERLEEGMKVEGRYRGRSRWYPGVISRCRLNGTYDIDYDDGEKEDGVARDLIRVVGVVRPKSPGHLSEGVVMVSGGAASERLEEGTKVEGRYRSEEHTAELQSLMRISYA